MACAGVKGGEGAKGQMNDWNDANDFKDSNDSKDSCQVGATGALALAREHYGNLHVAQTHSTCACHTNSFTMSMSHMTGDV